MTKEEMIERLAPLATDPESVREVLGIAWNVGVAQGMREVRELLGTSPPNGNAPESPDGSTSTGSKST